jgi:hypothetical protein
VAATPSKEEELKKPQALKKRPLKSAAPSTKRAHGEPMTFGDFAGSSASTHDRSSEYDHARGVWSMGMWKLHMLEQE